MNKNIKYAFFAVFVSSAVLFAAALFHYTFPVKHLDIIKEKAEKYNLEMPFVLAVINAESHFDENSVSSKGAGGLMQIVEPTADWIAEKAGIDDYSYEKINDPEMNVELGCWFLKWLIEKYNGNKQLVTAAYNAGHGRVSSWLYDSRYSENGENLDSIPFSETDNYVKKIEKYEKVYSVLIKLFGKC